jgi:hypothetical protein
MKLNAPSRLLLKSQSYSGASAVEKLDSRFFQNGDDLAQCVCPCADRAVKVLHSANGAKRHSGFLGKRALRPAQKCARRAYLPAADGDQRSTVSRVSAHAQEMVLFSQLVDLVNQFVG